MLATTAAQAQMVRKPSAYESGAGSPVNASANRTAPSDLAALPTQADFDRVARVFDANSASAMPHVLFVIDRQSKSTTLHFINTPRYAFHEDFLRAKGLLRGDKATLNRNYRAADRRFILGTLSWQPSLKAYSYEFWEGDQLTPELLQTTARALKTGFFAPVRFKANASAQEAVAQAAGIEAITQAQLLGAQTFLPLNLGQATGRLRIVASADRVSELQPQDIALLREVPISLPPVAGVVTERPSTLLSHVNLLARGWGVPNAYVQKAADQYAAFNQRWVHIEVQPTGFTLRAATDAERQAAEKQTRPRPASNKKILIQPDLRRSELAPLTSLRSADRKRCGAKAANLGEIQSDRLADVLVPDGFCIPFAAYADFMRGNGLNERIARMRQLPGFATDSGVRKQALSALQAEMMQW
ncbi:MAG: pyruvate, phosphate dikinase, partial [Comamonas sp.]